MDPKAIIDKIDAMETNLMELKEAIQNNIENNESSFEIVKEPKEIQEPIPMCMYKLKTRNVDYYLRHNSDVFLTRLPGYVYKIPIYFYDVSKINLHDNNGKLNFVYDIKDHKDENLCYGITLCFPLTKNNIEYLDKLYEHNWYSLDNAYIMYEAKDDDIKVEMSAQEFRKKYPFNCAFTFGHRKINKHLERYSIAVDNLKRNKST